MTLTATAIYSAHHLESRSVGTAQYLCTLAWLHPYVPIQATAPPITSDHTE